MSDTPENEVVESHDSNDGLVDALSVVVLIGIAVFTAVYWIAHQ